MNHDNKIRCACIQEAWVSFKMVEGRVQLPSWLVLTRRPSSGTIFLKDNVLLLCSPCEPDIAELWIQWWDGVGFVRAFFTLDEALADIRRVHQENAETRKQIAEAKESCGPLYEGFSCVLPKGHDNQGMHLAAPPEDHDWHPLPFRIVSIEFGSAHFDALKAAGLFPQKTP